MNAHRSNNSDKQNHWSGSSRISDGTPKRFAAIDVDAIDDWQSQREPFKRIWWWISFTDGSKQCSHHPNNSLMELNHSLIGLHHSLIISKCSLITQAILSLCWFILLSSHTILSPWSGKTGTNSSRLFWIGSTSEMPSVGCTRLQLFP